MGNFQSYPFPPGACLSSIYSLSFPHCFAGWQGVDHDYFNSFPVYTSKLGPKDEPVKEWGGFLKDKLIAGQIIRTQPQYGKYDIMNTYLHVVKNASHYIYIKNQYFRWPPLADAILEVARQQSHCGRDPAKHDSLYLFVVTNSSDAGIGSGTQKTYEMLDILGRSDTIPEVTRQNRVDDLETRIEHAEGNLREAKALGALLFLAPEEAKKRNQEQINGWEAEVKRLKAQRDKLAGGETIVPEERPGLKIHVCTLTAPDTPEKRVWDLDKQIKQAEKDREEAEKAIENQREYDRQAAHTQPGYGRNEALRVKWEMLMKRLEAKQAKVRELKVQRGGPWPEVYVHSKLMIINETYMTLGSANINSRSMEVDTEMNIAHHRPEITQQARRDLWRQHTNGRGAMDDMEAAFEAWRDIINENAKNKKNEKAPIASLCGFLRTDPKITNKD